VFKVNDEGSAGLDSDPHTSSSSSAAAAASASPSPSTSLSALPPSPSPRSMKPLKTTGSSSTQIQAQHLEISKDHKTTASKPRNGAIQTQAAVDTGLQTSRNQARNHVIAEGQKITSSEPHDKPHGVAIPTRAAVDTGLRTSQIQAQHLEISEDQKITASKPHDQAIAIRAVLDIGLQTSQDGGISQDQKINALKPCRRTASIFSSSSSLSTTTATTATTSSSSSSSSATTTNTSLSSKHLLPSSEQVTLVAELGKPEGRADSNRHPMTSSPAPSVYRSTSQGVQKSNEKSQESPKTARQAVTRSSTVVSRKSSDRQEKVQCNWKLKSQTLNTRTWGDAVRVEDCSSWVEEQSMKIERRVSETRMHSRKTRQSSETQGDDAADLSSRSLIRQRLKVGRACVSDVYFPGGGVVAL